MPTVQEKRRQRTKESIKLAAINIARKEGWNNVTIRKIAEEILYTPPVVYEYFKSKSDLFNHLVSEGFQKLYEATIDSTSKVETPENKLRTMAQTRFLFALENPTLHSMMFNSVNPDWGKLEIIKAMKKMKSLVYEWLFQISGKKEKCDELFINLVALIMGYSFLVRNMNEEKTLLNHFKDGMDSNIKEHYLGAIDRYIESIKFKK